MANTVQIKRGSNASVNAHTGPSGELIYNLDTGRLHAQDGSTAGGKPHALVSDVDLKANAAVNIIAGDGLTGGGNLSADRTINVGAGTGISVAADAVSLDAASISSLAKADTALQAPGGGAGQILAKNSATNNDVVWVSSEAATAVSYGPQALTPEQQAQALDNIDGQSASSMAGEVVMLPGGIIPAGRRLLKLNGPTLNRASYPHLWKYAQDSGALVAQGSKTPAQFGTGDGSTTFTLPDWRGYFIRAWDDGRGIDAGRIISAIQSMATQDHVHNLPFGFDGGASWPSIFNEQITAPLYGGVVETVYRTEAAHPGSATSGSTIIARSSGMIGLSGETRPINIAALFAIRY